MGVGGTGETTLMDVLAGRKIRGYVEGDISISDFPKKQVTFARILGYCKQNDIHSPQVTVSESLINSASLRLPRKSAMRKSWCDEGHFVKTLGPCLLTRNFHSFPENCLYRKRKTENMFSGINGWREE
ncbi:Abc transporter g family member [Thalictrum thalictroides]|uniref:Abc transporter g family member n=1 Tax=Thalictrum thalictroides TaxID=46969 RepID=A0A7J6VYA8_THATH|nr:Abc transporter g family member [Thalictrum thalictroides]